MALRSRRLIGPLALAVVAAAVAVVGLRSASGSYEVRAVFDQVNGLVPGADVEASGLRVGNVDSIALGRDGLPVVSMRIERSYRLRRGAVANLRSFSVAGEVNRFVSLTAGDGPVLHDGATIGLAQTDQPVEVDQALSTLDPRTRAQVRSALGGIDAATTGRGGDIAAALRHSADAVGNTADLLHEATSDGAALRTLVSRGRQVLSTLASDPATLGTTADRLAAVLRTTAARQAELAHATALLPAGLRSPRLALARVDASVGNLRTMVRSARPGVAQLVPLARELRPTLHAARPALRSAAGLVAAGPSDTRRLTPLLRTATPSLRTLAPVLASANPILDELRARMPDFFSFFSNWADFTADFDAIGHAARIGLVYAPPPNNTITPSDDRAGQLAAPFVRTPGVLEGQPWTDYRKSFVSGGGGQ